MSQRPEQHPLDTPGDFYVVEGGCVYCMGPEGTAPELVAMAPDSTGCDCCFFAKQPVTAEEIAAAVDAIKSSSCCNLRYGGTDPAIIEQLVEAGCGHACDHLEEAGENARQKPVGTVSKLKRLFGGKK